MAKVGALFVPIKNFAQIKTVNNVFKKLLHVMKEQYIGII